MYTKYELAIILLRTKCEEIEQLVETIKHFNLFEDLDYLEYAKNIIINKYK